MISNLHPEEPSSSSHLPSPRHDDHQQWNYGGNPLAQPMSHESQALGPFGGDFQPGLYKQVDRKRANPVPMGLSGFALTTFLLSIINLNVRGVSLPYIVVGPSLAYGGLIQLLAGMWYVYTRRQHECSLTKTGKLQLETPLVLSRSDRMAASGFRWESSLRPVASTLLKHMEAQVLSSIPC